MAAHLVVLYVRFDPPLKSWHISPLSPYPPSPALSPGGPGASPLPSPPDPSFELKKSHYQFMMFVYVSIKENQGYMLIIKLEA